MASISYTNMISTTARTIAQYVYDNNQTSLQTLLGDTDFTCDGKYLMYKGIPFSEGVCGEGSSTSSFMMYPSSASAMAVYGTLSKRSDWISDGATDIQIYDFTSFYLWVIFGTLENVQSDTNGYFTLLIDKTNAEIFSGISTYTNSQVKGYSGMYFGYLNNAVGTYTNYVPTDYWYSAGGATITSEQINRACIREESASETTHIKLVGLDGRQATRVYFFKKFPRGCSNSVIQVDDKYFYMLPYPQVLPTLKSYDTSHTETTWEQEVYCTIGIDVTGEVS